MDRPHILKLQLSPEHTIEALDASGCSTVSEALKICLSLSRVTWVIEDASGIIGVFGLGSGEAQTYPWFLAAPEVHDKYWLTLAKESRAMVNFWRSQCPYMVNWIWDGNPTDIKWLKWLGFEFPDVEPYVINGHNYLKFEMHGGI